MDDPYGEGKIVVNPYSRRRKILGRLVAIMGLKITNRNMELIKPISRVLKSQAIHELILTDELDSGPGDVVDHASYIGFAEFNQGGVALVGDSVYIEGGKVGTITGFSNSHFPNHIGIAIRAKELKTGEELGLSLDSSVEIRK